MTFETGLILGFFGGLIFGVVYMSIWWLHEHGQWNEYCKKLIEKHIQEKKE